MARRKGPPKPAAPTLTAVPPVPPVAKSGQADAEVVDEGPASEALLLPREQIFIEALAGGATSCQASKVAGISDRSGRRWRQRPEIQASVRARLGDALGAARAILACGAARAATAMVSMADGSEPAEAARCSAARGVLDGANLAVEIEEIQTRLAELESRQLPGRPGFNRKGY
jgi:hypothetical protein